jgi:hypothetical protein
MLSLSRWPIKDVLEFDGTEFKFSFAFNKALENSPNAFIVMCVGLARSGKSSLLNHLITNNIEGRQPFPAFAGAFPVTQKFQFCGPLKFGDLSRIHAQDFSGTSDPDLFLIDCEGLASLAGTSPGLPKALFALGQISSVIILVVKGSVTVDVINDYGALLAFTRAFSREVGDFATGFVVVQNAVGVKDEEMLDLGLEEQDQLRIEANKTSHKDFLANLRINQDFGNLMVMCQPVLADVALFWRSMYDLVRFMRNVADMRRRPFSGKFLSGMFKQVTQHIMHIHDFENPDIPMGEVFASLIENLLTEAKDDALKSVDKLITFSVQQIHPDVLRGGATGIVNGVIAQIMEAFAVKAEQLHQGLLTALPDLTMHVKSELEDAVLKRAHDDILSTCALYLQRLGDEIWNEIKDEIGNEMNRTPSKDIGNYDFAGRTAAWHAELEKRVTEMAADFNPELPKTERFDSVMNSLKHRLSELLTGWETSKRQEFLEHQAREKDAELNRLVEENAQKLSQAEVQYERQLSEQTQQASMRIAEAAAQVANCKRESGFSLGIDIGGFKLSLGL